MNRQAGQLLVIGFEPQEMTSGLRALLEHVQPAGVILFARNIATLQQTHQLLKECRASVPTPMFACVDMEGGKVDRLRGALGPSPSAAEVFATGDRRLFRKHGRVIGDACRAAGFNTDLAPVVDLGFAVSGKVMGSRVVSDEPAEVVRYAREFVAGLRAAGVLGALKHFPGLGEASLDTHEKLPSVGKTLKKLWEEDILPYRALKNEAAMVLVGHAAYPSVTGGKTPASLSRKWITDVLRKRVGYRGLVISDDLEMGGVLKAAAIEEAAVEFVRAGGDLCLVCHKEDAIVKCHEALIRETERDRRFAEWARVATRKVLAFKKRAKEMRRTAAAPTQAKVDKLSRMVWEFGEEVRLAGLERRERG